MEHPFFLAPKFRVSYKKKWRHSGTKEGGKKHYCRGSRFSFWQWYFMAQVCALLTVFAGRKLLMDHIQVVASVTPPGYMGHL